MRPEELMEAAGDESRGPADLKRVQALCRLLERQEAEVQRLTDELAAAKDDYNKTRMEDLPELMREVGVSAITLDDGSTVTVEEEVSTSITAAKAPRALQWLIDNGFGGIIKSQIITAFDSGDREIAAETAAELREKFDGVTLKEVVHPQTLKSFVKEQLREGRDIPFDLFSIHPYNVAKLKRSKK